MSLTAWFWAAFGVIVFLLLALDLEVFHKHETVVTLQNAATWTAIRVAVALLFGVAVCFLMGSQTGLEYFTGYVIEFSLSMDSVFVFLMLFSYFNVPARFPVLFWGILGALIMRGLIILIGSVLIASFHWVLYLFGAFLVFTGGRMALHHNAELEPEKNPVFVWARRLLPFTSDYDHDHWTSFTISGTDCSFSVHSKARGNQGTSC